MLDVFTEVIMLQKGFFGFVLFCFYKETLMISNNLRVESLLQEKP